MVKTRFSFDKKLFCGIIVLCLLMFQMNVVVFGFVNYGT